MHENLTSSHGWHSGELLSRDAQKGRPARPQGVGRLRRTRRVRRKETQD